VRALAPALVAVAALFGTVAAAQLWPAGPSASQADGDGAPASIEVIPHVEQVMERGQAQRFRAVVRDRAGRALEDAKVMWSVTPRVGTIDATGLFVATSACLRWDGIGIVTVTLPAGVRGQMLSDGALVAIHYDPSCLTVGEGER
jgi:hypothetical protein